MAIIEIQNRWTGAVLYSGEHADVKGAIEAAVKADAYLADADLARANLTDAYLARANLTGANLAGADLADAHLSSVNLTGANLTGATLAGADLSGADLANATLAGAKVGAGDDEAVLVGSRPIVKIGPIGSRNDWLLVFWCGDAGVRISTGCQQQITEAYFLERLAEAHGEGEQANIHAQHYLEALAFAKRLLKDQAEGKL